MVIAADAAHVADAAEVATHFRTQGMPTLFEGNLTGEEAVGRAREVGSARVFIVSGPANRPGSLTELDLKGGASVATELDALKPPARKVAPGRSP